MVVCLKKKEKTTNCGDVILVVLAVLFSSDYGFIVCLKVNETLWGDASFFLPRAAFSVLREQSSLKGVKIVNYRNELKSHIIHDCSTVLQTNYISKSSSE